MKEVISNRQGISMIMLFILGSAVVLGSAQEAESDLWIAILLGLAAALLTVLLYSSILSHFPGKDFFDILIVVFGRVLGKVIAIVYIFYAFYLGTLVLSNFSIFINIVGLEATPRIVLASMIMVLIILGVKYGIEVLGRWSEFFVRILYPIILLMIPLMLSMVEVNNLKPVFANGIQPILQGAFKVYAFPLAETVIFIMIFDAVNVVKKKKDIKKIFLIGVLLGGLLIFITGVTAYLTLGNYAYSSSYFPVYSAVSRVNLKDILERVEIFLAVSFIMGGFVKISICLLGCCRGIGKVCGFKDYRFIVTPIGILVLLVSITNFQNIMEMIAQIPYDNTFAFLQQVIFPVILLVVIKIKILIKKRKESAVTG